MEYEPVESERVSHEVSAADFREKSSFKQLLGSLFGFDFFISYAWADARDYAVELAERLEREVDGRKYSCFLDSDDYSKGDDWKEAGHEALKKTSILILVGSPRALKSAPVLREVSIYAAQKNRIIPIEFVGQDGNGTLDATRNPSALHQFIRPEILRIQEVMQFREDTPNQLVGPSEEVVRQITGSFDLIAQADKRASVFGALAIVFAIVALLAIGFWRSSESNRREARKQTTVAQLNERNANKNQAKTEFTLGRVALSQDNIDEALVWWQKSLSTATDPTWRSSMCKLIGASSSRLQGTMVQPKHGKAVALSLDGKIAVTIDDNQAVCWNTTTGTVEGTPVKRQQLKRAWISSDGSKLLTSSQGDGVDNSVLEFWDVLSGKSAGPVVEFSSSVQCAAFSRDGKKVILGRSEYSCVLDMDSATQIWEHKHDNFVTAVGISTAGETLVTATAPLGALGSRNEIKRHSQVSVWTSEGRLIGNQVQQREPVRAIDISPDQATFVTGCDDRTAQMWDAISGEPLGQAFLHNGAVTAVAYSSDGRRLLTGGTDNLARLWDVSVIGPRGIGLESITFPQFGEPLGHDQSLLALTFDPDDGTAITMDTEGTVRKWNPYVSTHKKRGPWFSSGVTGVAISPNGQYIAAASENGIAVVSDVTNDTQHLLQHTGYITSIAFAQGGKTIVTGSLEKTAQLWGVDNGEKRGDPILHTGAVLAIAASPDGKFVVTGSGTIYSDKAPQGETKFWNLETGACQTVEEPKAAVDCVAFSPDGKIFAAGCRDGTIRIWNSGTKSLMKTLDHRAHVNAVAFSADGRWLASGGGSWKNPRYESRVWDVRTGQLLLAPLRHPVPVFFVAFTPDGHSLVTGSFDGARLWDVPAGSLRVGPLKQPPSLAALAMSPDGSTLVTGGGMPGTLQETFEMRFWDAKNGLQLGPPLKQRFSFGAVAFSADGKTVISGSDPPSHQHDGECFLWDVPTPAIDDRTRLQASVELRTGKRLSESNEVELLTYEELLDRRKKLAKDGPCDAPTWDEYEAWRSRHP